MFQSMTKTETETCASQAIPVENILFRTYHQEGMNILIEIQMWKHANSVPSNLSFYKKRDALSILLGAKPLFHRTFEFRTAVWGLSWEGEKFIVFYSNRGLQLSILPSFPVQNIEGLLKAFHRQVKAKTMTELVERYT